MVSCRVVVGNGSLEVMVRYKVKFLWGKGGWNMFGWEGGVVNG